MIRRKSIIIPKEKSNLSISNNRLNAYKMSTTTALKTHIAKLAPSFKNSGYSDIKMPETAIEAEKMSTLAADLCKAATTTNQKTPPMEAAAVVVNSIIYSKPSFCSIVVDIGGKEGSAAAAAAKTTGSFSDSEKQKPAMSSFSHSSEKKKGVSPTPATIVNQSDAHVYMMSTTMNGAIHHQISEICDNLIAMGLFGMVANSEHDEDSLIEFSYDDEDDGDDIVFLHSGEDFEEHHIDDNNNDDDDDDDDEDDDDDDDDEEEEEEEYDYNYCHGYDNNDNETDEEDACLYDCHGQDVTDFAKCPVTTRAFPIFNCDKKSKKVRFNLHPTVHVMHTWDYAYRSARKGEWEMYARDRERFKLRIQRASQLLNPILDREHRLKVYEQRFSKPNGGDRDEITAAAEAEKPEAKNINQKQKHHKKKKKRKRRRPNF